MRTTITEKINRGEVWMVDLREGSVGSEQGGIRPALVVSNDKNNMYSSTLTIVPLTSKQNKNKIPTHVLMENEPYLTEVSIALVEQIKTIDKVRLIERMGRTTDYIMIEIDEAIKIQNGLKQVFSYEKVYEMIKQIENIKIIINQVGKLPRLVQVYTYEVNKFKEYCNEYKMNYKIIFDSYNKQLNKVV